MRFGVALTVIALACCCLARSDENAARDLVGHWKLAGDTRDSSGRGNHARNQGADLDAKGPTDRPRSAARFNGRDNYLEVAPSESLRLGKQDFSIGAWVHVDPAGDDVPGDLLSLYDPVKRQGFNLGILTAHSTTNQANWQNVAFGIDNGQLEPKWTDHGRPGNSIFIMALAVHDGQLFAGTCEAAATEVGHVYRLAADGKWIDCGSPHPCNAVSALAAFDGKLYAGVSHYRTAGSALSTSENTRPGGKVFRYEGDGKWTDCGQLGESVAIGGMAVFKGKLYASSLYAPAGVFRYEGGTRWVSCGSGPPGGPRPGPRRVEALTVFNGHLYGTSYDGGLIFRYDGDTKWSVVGTIPDMTQTYGFATHEGRLHVSMWPKANVFRYDGGDRWTDVGQLGSELESMGIAVYNGKLYGGTLPLAEVYRHDGGTKWTATGQLDMTPNVKYRRAWTMATYHGRLFCGTLPSGRVYSLEAGRVATLDRELPAGWHHVAGVRDGGVLRLYVDGKQVAVSRAFKPDDYDLTTDRPLRIGFGAQDYFHGRLSDVRLYRRALSADEVAGLARR